MAQMNMYGLYISYMFIWAISPRLVAERGRHWQELGEQRAEVNGAVRRNVDGRAHGQRRCDEIAVRSGRHEAQRYTTAPLDR